MSVAQTVLVLVGAPLAIYAVIALLTLKSKFTRTPRYRPGDKWEFGPLWWTANPKGLDVTTSGHGTLSEVSAAANSKASARGGARGNW